VSIIVVVATSGSWSATSRTRCEPNSPMRAGLQFNFGKCDLKAALAESRRLAPPNLQPQLKTLRGVAARHLVRFGAVLGADCVGGDEGV
jgi:hypothetical protein